MISVGTDVRGGGMLLRFTIGVRDRHPVAGTTPEPGPLNTGGDL